MMSIAWAHAGSTNTQPSKTNCKMSRLVPTEMVTGSVRHEFGRGSLVLPPQMRRLGRVRRVDPHMKPQLQHQKRP